MYSRLRWKGIFIVVLTVFVSVGVWYPTLADRLGLPVPDLIASRRLSLGLDLAGGVHMTLRINVDEAVRAETDQVVATLRESAAKEGIGIGGVETLGPGAFHVRGVDPADVAAFTRLAEEVAIDFDRELRPDGSIAFTMGKAAVAGRHEQTVGQARRIVERRVDELGVTEPLIAVQGRAGDELLVQLPGTTDVARAIEILGTTAVLEWKLVEHGPATSREALLARWDGAVPPGVEVVAGPSQTDEGAGPAYYLVRTTPVVAGRDLRNARAAFDEYQRPVVAFSLAREAAARFAEFTAANVGRDLAIVLDGLVQSAPRIESPIDGGEGRIRGRFTPEEAADLSLVLRAGALPASMTYLGGGFVGPSLGHASIRAGLAASLAGLALVTTFMLAYYKRAGVNAIVSLVANLLLLLGMMTYVDAVLTLPGIAGLVLTIGMGIDSSVLIFERIKEELAAGRSPRAAVAAGFDRVILTIVDTHVASLIAAACLFQFGTGPIRGFATTLTFGLLANVFTSVFVSRTLFEIVTSRGLVLGLRTNSFPRLRRMAIDVHRWRRPALALSTAALLLGVGFVGLRGLPLGIDFTGGTLLIAQFRAPVAESVVHDAIPGDEIVQRYGDPSDHALLIRVPQGEGSAVPELTERVARIIATLHEAGVPDFEVMGSDTLGPAIGADLQRKGIYATVASLAGIAGYVALRFRPAFAVGAIIATCHDILLTIAALSAFGYELSLNVVAAVLTIAGYSVNDTIVIFDRVRERLRAEPRAPLGRIVNDAVNQTLARTAITAGTTALAVLAQFVFGGEALRGFAFAMLVGIVTGTYSTVFIATVIAVKLSARRNRGRTVPSGTLGGSRRVPAR